MSALVKDLNHLISGPSLYDKARIAWQMHNAGLIDENKDVTTELDPKTAGLISV